ncbi:MAG: acetate kinase, partial [Microcoleaceae cyanobacterium]
MKILILNAGSSSQKSCLYHLEGATLPEQTPEPIWEVTIDWTASPDAGLMKIKANGIKQEISLDPTQRLDGVSKMLNSLTQGDTKVLEQMSEIDVVGHRVVHGGAEYSRA